MNRDQLLTVADLNNGLEELREELRAIRAMFEPPRMNIQQAAEYCDKSPRTVKKWIDDGKLQEKGTERHRTVAVRDLEPFRRK